MGKNGKDVVQVVAVGRPAYPLGYVSEVGELRAEVQRLEAELRDAEAEIAALHERCGDLEAELERARQDAEVIACNVASALDGPGGA